MDWTICEDTSRDQIRGQLSFVDTSKKTDDRKVFKKVYASPCGGCICNQCANDVNGRGKASEAERPCFNCDDCRNYDGDFKKKNNKRFECESFKITSYQVERNRARIKLIR